MEKYLGIVQMPLERYDELILENKRMMEELDNSVPLERYDELILENKRMMEKLDNSVPLEEYNKLKEQLANIAKIETSLSGEPRLIVNINLLADDLREEFEQSEHVDKWEMMDLSDDTVTIWSAFKEKPQEVVEDQA